MKIKTLEKGICLEIQNFSLEDTLQCGQCFRWKRQKNHNCYTLIAHQRILSLKAMGEGRVWFGCDLDDFERIWRKYFDLDNDYNSIQRKIAKDRIIQSAIEYAPGIRILYQEPYETIITFILSANNNMTRIGKTIENICTTFGERIGEAEFAFPNVERMAACKADELYALGAGYRSPYIIQASKQILEDPSYLDLNSKCYTEALQQLMQLPGVGPKVANCILLFSSSHREAFPIDTWVKKVLLELYDCSSQTECLKMQKYFGKEAGYANQYLFYAVRRLGVQTLLKSLPFA